MYLSSYNVVSEDIHLIVKPLNSGQQWYTKRTNTCISLLSLPLKKILEVQMFKSVGMNVYDCLYVRVFVYI